MSFLNITEIGTDKEKTIILEGVLNSDNARQLEDTLKQCMAEAERLIFDMKGLSYMSSAGLRILLSAQKLMGKKGGMVLRNVNENILEIFEITGFADVLFIE